MSTAMLPRPIDDLGIELSENGERYEIIDGVRVELQPMSAESSVLASDLVYHLSHYRFTHDLGRVVTEVLFRLPLTQARNRRPDVAFVPYSRAPKNAPVPSTNAWDVLPDLVTEVISPTDSVEDLMERIHEYFEAGIRLVWVIFPRRKEVYVYESPSKVTVKSRTETLDGGAVLPGFVLPLAELFPLPPS